MNGDIIQINLHKSMLAMVELNRHVKHAYNTDNVRIGAVDGDGPGGEVDVEKGGSNIRIYRNHNDNDDRRRKNNQNRSKNGPGGAVLGPGGHGGDPGDLAAGGDRRGVDGQGRVRLDGQLSPNPRPYRDRDKTLYINEHSKTTKKKRCDVIASFQKNDVTLTTERKSKYRVSRKSVSKIYSTLFELCETPHLQHIGTI